MWVINFLLCVFVVLVFSCDKMVKSVSGFSLRKSILDFSENPKKEDGLVDGLIKGALEKLSQVELQPAITNWIPFLQEINGAKFLARALAKSTVENSEMQNLRRRVSQ